MQDPMYRMLVYLRGPRAVEVFFYGQTNMTTELVEGEFHSEMTQRNQVRCSKTHGWLCRTENVY